VRRGFATTRAEPGENSTNRVNRGTNGFRAHLHQIDVLGIPERMRKEELVDGRPTAERHTLGEPRVIEDVAQRAADDQILFYLPWIGPRRRPAPLLDKGAGNHASISTGALMINFQLGASVAALAAAPSAAMRFTDGSRSFMDLAARVKGRNALA